MAKIVTFSVLIRPMMTRDVPGWVLEVKTLIYQELLIGEDKSALSDMEKLIFSAPIDQSGRFFLAKIVTFSVLICPMMTPEMSQAGYWR